MNIRWIRLLFGLKPSGLSDTAREVSAARQIKTAGNYHYCYDKTDLDYFGGAAVVEAELQVIRAQRENKHKPLVGLALSGGGIRSASFSLGVLQALSYKKALAQVDYLSTVSGGGYIGACLSYLLHRPWTIGKSEPVPGDAGKKTQEPIRFGLGRNDFPLGSYPMTSSDMKERTAVNTAGLHDEALLQYRSRGTILRFLRQHASYLNPGNGIDLFSLLAVLLRNSFFSFAFYFALLTLIFTLFGKRLLFVTPAEVQIYWPWLALSPWTLPVTLNSGLWIVIGMLLLFAFLIPVYAVITCGFGKIINGNWPSALRYKMEKFIGRLLKWAVVLAIVSCIPYVYATLQSFNQHEAATLSVTASHVASAEITTWSSTVNVAKGTGGVFDQADNYVGLISSITSAITGLVAVFGLFVQTNQTKKNPILQRVLLYIAVGSLLFALTILAYWLMQKWWDTAESSLWWAIASILIVGWFCNLNYVSMHRYYRDRLADTFLPDVGKELSDDPAVHGRSAVGNNAYLSELYGGTKHARDNNAKTPMPYHIINSNVVLVNSKIAKFRGRGGDNFILSPLFCGSNATGWSTTASTIYEGMTLASAMAISGAAVNTNAGNGGEGVTRSPLLSILLGIFNIRLGYWLPNPKWLHHRKEYTAQEKSAAAQINHCSPEQINVASGLSKWLMHLSRCFCQDETPNMFYPGLAEVIFRNALNEDSAMLQLSDGGHFENLGLYELIRRRLPLIIVADGSADPDYKFDDLANALEKVRADFGALITFPRDALEDLVPCRETQTTEDDSDSHPVMRYAKRGYLLGKIDYANNQHGVLLYLTTTFIHGLSADLHGYRRSHPHFPDEPTADQFFDEKQFEAYRELGYQLTYKMLANEEIASQPYVSDGLGI